MPGYESDESMEAAPLTPGLSETHSMQASACDSEDQNSSPDRSPKRRCTNRPSESRLNGDDHYTASATSPPGHSTASAFVPRSPGRSWTAPAPSMLRSSAPAPSLSSSILPASGLPSSTIPAPGSSRSFGGPQPMPTNSSGLGCGTLLARPCISTVTHPRLEASVKFMAKDVQEPDSGDGYGEGYVEEDAVVCMVAFRIGRCGQYYPALK
ncbi:hypothetical protein V492_01389 [Pseudogymnoascus sp. VKM F-4246]|nr:hypothetical protein V492_01389 [Pseudogymnoascus sp. VKM F-4246]